MSNKPVITPTASVLKDDKFILAAIDALVTIAINLVPELKPVATPLTILLFSLFAFLIAHQGTEDVITALGDYRVLTASQQTTTILPAGDTTVVKTDTPTTATLAAQAEAATSPVNEAAG